MSIKVHFDKLRKSEIIIENINDRILPILEKFDFNNLNLVRCEVSMNPSVDRMGQNFFKIKLRLKKYHSKEVFIEKSNKSFYKALDLVTKDLFLAMGKKQYQKKRIETIKVRRVKSVPAS